jgi:undecaprenyl-diphosphatase
MGLNPSSPQMTMLLVMLHTGTMFAVIVYFWKAWRRNYFSSTLRSKDFILQIIVATACTGIVGLGLKIVIEKVFMKGAAKAEVEDLFNNIPLIAAALFAVGVLIIIAGLKSEKSRLRSETQLPQSCIIGVIQGLCLPFRGFSRSGATISTGLILGLAKEKLEEFSFALAVVLTPVLIAMEGKRLLDANKIPSQHVSLGHLLTPCLVGMVFSFIAGLGALKWLSSWLEGGQWKLFGFYCLAASAVVLALHYTQHI